MPHNKINVLYIDDEQVYQTAFRASFRRLYSIFTASSAVEAMDVLNRERIQVIVSDNRMPGISGIEFFESILDKYHNPVRILLTAYRDIQEAIEAINCAHVHKFIMKPWSEPEMELIIEQAYEIFTEEKEKKDMLERLEFFVRQRLLS